MEIKLHTPRTMDDNETTTLFESKNIIQIKSVLGDDTKEGSYFWLEGLSDRQYCLESVDDLRKLMKEGRFKKLFKFIFSHKLIIGVWAFILSIIASFIANNLSF